MKKLTVILLPLVVVLLLVIPMGMLTSFLTDLEFEIYYLDIFGAVSLGFMVLGLLFLWIGQVNNTLCNICCLLLLPLSIIIGTVWILMGSVQTVVLGFAYMVCGGLLLWRSTSQWKGLSILVGVLVGVGCTGLCCLVLLADAVMPSVTEIAKYPSPGGTYTARVAVYDGGGRGANTTVELYDHRSDVNLVIGKLTLPKQQIYSANLLEDESLTVLWLDDNTLQIGDSFFQMD